MKNMKQCLILGLAILMPVLFTALLLSTSTPQQPAQALTTAVDTMHSTG